MQHPFRDTEGARLSSLCHAHSIHNVFAKRTGAGLRNEPQPPYRDTDCASVSAGNFGRIGAVELIVHESRGLKHNPFSDHERIEGVTTDELVSLTNDFFHGDKIAVAVPGNLEGMKLTREQLAC
jgi:hypothetical protein